MKLLNYGYHKNIINYMTTISLKNKLTSQTNILVITTKFKNEFNYEFKYEFKYEFEYRIKYEFKYEIK